MRLGISKTLVSYLQNGERLASPEVRAKCLEAYSIPLEDWDRPDPDDTLELASDAETAPPPKSEQRPARKLGSTREELWCTVEDIDRERRSGALSSSQRASLLGKRAGTLSAIARMEKSAALEEHPDFEAFRADIIASIREAFGDECTPDRLRAMAESMRRRGKLRKAAA
jgi:transcriptional regulator with XRE-family HTH domain